MKMCSKYTELYIDNTENGHYLNLRDQFAGENIHFPLNEKRIKKIIKKLESILPK